MANIIPEETEREILRLRATSLGYDTIGRMLNVSPSTVRNVVLRGYVRSQEDRERINRGSQDEWKPTPADQAEIEERKRECREKHFAMTRE